MTIVTALAVLLYAGVIVYGFSVRQRTDGFGNTLIVNALTGLALVLSLVTTNAVVKYALLALAFVLLAIQFMARTVPVSKAARPVLWLTGTVATFTTAMYMASDASPKVQTILLALVIGSGFALIASIVWAGVRLARSAHAK